MLGKNTKLAYALQVQALRREGEAQDRANYLGTVALDPKGYK